MAIVSLVQFCLLRVLLVLDCLLNWAIGYSQSKLGFFFLFINTWHRQV